MVSHQPTSVYEEYLEAARASYEKHLNELLTPDEALALGPKRKGARRLLGKGKYGTALRRYKPAAFEEAFLKWHTTLTNEAHILWALHRIRIDGELSYDDYVAHWRSCYNGLWKEVDGYAALYGNEGWEVRFVAGRKTSRLGGKWVLKRQKASRNRAASIGP